jgi:hypothetical protein
LLNKKYKKLKYLGVFALASLSIFALQLTVSPAAKAAQTYNVTTTSACSLADAYTSIATNAAVGSCAAPSAPNTINIAAGTYTLSADLPVLNTDGDITVSGAVGGGTIIDGNGHVGIQAVGVTAAYNYLITNLTFQNFTATNSQHVIDVFGSLTADHLIFRNNTCTSTISPVCSLLGGGNNSASNLVVSNSAFYNNTASSVINLGYFDTDYSGSAAFNIFNNTFSNNSAGAISIVNIASAASVTANITNNTFANNTVSDDSGQRGVIAINPAEVPIPTYTASVNMKSNIFYANTNSTSGSRNCSASLTPSSILNSLGGNISSDATCNTWLNQTNDKNSTDAYLGLLTLVNGTYVRPLASNSPAIGNAIASGAPSVDQRGVARPQNGTYDSGAYEYVFSPTPTPTPSPTPSSNSTGALANTGNSSLYIILAAALLITLGIIGFAVFIERKKNKNAK